jgi:hypothetical protein
MKKSLFERLFQGIDAKIENPRVAGSIPAPGTTSPIRDVTT